MSKAKLEFNKVEEFEHVRDSKYQNIYVDKLSSLSIGPNIAKIGFGIEDPQNKKVFEVINLNIPTASLLEFSSFLNRVLENPEIKNGLKAEVEKIIEKLK
ncbi:hypothetical protein [uncultured Acinetobacter sp.]|uniref:hypothetical protein n=1 Tax=uncultured Acinetobacter sp. TaxID=165433 RepID=UPI00258BFA28|nr:hypothetical protein [uncultured Acinetobacter sp.]